MAGGGALFGLFLVFFLCPPQLVFSAVGVGYPTYASLKMLAEDKTEDAAMWITYWCLFSLLKVVMNPLCLLYTSPSPRDRTRSRMPSSA